MDATKAGLWLTICTACMAIALGGCELFGPIEDPSWPSGPPKDSTITFAGHEYSSWAVVDVAGAKEAPGLYDPAVYAQVWATEYPLDLYVEGYAGLNPRSSLWREGIIFRVSDPSTDSSTFRPGDYQLDRFGRVRFYPSSSVACYSSAATATITQSGNVGDPISGTIYVIAWDLNQLGSKGCPVAPVAGSFSVVRGYDDTWGNNGTNSDYVSVTRTAGVGTDTTLFPTTSTWTEDASRRNDPLITVGCKTDVSGKTEIRVLAEADKSLNARARTVKISLGTISNCVPSKGSYMLSPGAFTESIVTNPPSTTSCVASTGTVTITSYVSAKHVVGSFSIPITAVSGNPACPVSYTGTFSIAPEIWP